MLSLPIRKQLINYQQRTVFMYHVRVEYNGDVFYHISTSLNISDFIFIQNNGKQITKGALNHKSLMYNLGKELQRVNQS